jgi:hypothetical protein
MFRFEQHHDHTAASHGEKVNLHQLRRDIEDETLTDKECDTIVWRFYKRHPFMDFMMKGCATCGVRHIERLEDPMISCVNIPFPILGLLTS